MTMFGISIIIVYLVLGVLLVIFGAWLVKQISDAQLDYEMSGLPAEGMSHFGFAAIDPYASDDKKMDGAIRECADVAEFLLPQIHQIQQTLASSGPRRVILRNGAIRIYYPRDFDVFFSTKFCLGDSLAGAGIEEKSVLLSLDIDGDQLGQLTKDFISGLADEQVPDEISAGGFRLDLAGDVLYLPGEIPVQPGQILALEMAEETRQKYLDEFGKRESFKSFLGERSKNDADAMLSKLRIFGGFEVAGEGKNLKVEIKCYRHEKDAPMAKRGSRNHPLDKVNGFVVQHWRYEQILALSQVETKHMAA